MSTKSNSIVLVIGIITLLYVATVSNSSVAATDPYTSLYPSGQNENSTINTESNINPTDANNTNNLNSTSQGNTVNDVLVPSASSPIVKDLPSTAIGNVSANATSEQSTASNSSSPLTTQPANKEQADQQQNKDELQKKIKASIPTYLILVDLKMPNKNTTDYGVIDVTVTLNDITKVKSLNTTTFSGDSSVLPFRFNANIDKTPIQVNNEFNLCASGEFLATSVCNTGTIQTINPPLTKTSIDLG
jgi:hypothetical protein